MHIFLHDEIIKQTLIHPQLSGGAMLGIGIWLRVDDSILELIKLTEFATDGDQMENVAWVLIAVGAFVFLVGFLGCFGAITENRCMLGVVSEMRMFLRKNLEAY